MQVRRLDDPVAFLDAAGPLLLAEEARNNLVLGIAGTLRDHPQVYPEFRLWLVEEGGEIVGAAVRTPPHHLALAGPLAPRAAEALVAAIDEELPGVVGPAVEAEEFAARWSTSRGARARGMMAQGVYALERVVPARPVGGALREAGVEDVPLLVDWWCAFVDEVVPRLESDEQSARAAIEHRLGSPGWGVVVWDDGGPVSMSAHGNPTPNGVRVGPVYTPPRLRSRGYASALVAEQSARLLAGGRRFCFLFTDLANPTSNAIYRRIGYELVCEAVEIAFS